MICVPMLERGSSCEVAPQALARSIELRARKHTNKSADPVLQSSNRELRTTADIKFSKVLGIKKHGSLNPFTGVKQGCSAALRFAQGAL